jgi:hypothetical protein
MTCHYIKMTTDKDEMQRSKPCTALDLAAGCDPDAAFQAAAYSGF